MARQQRRYAAGPNSSTMVALCLSTSFVVMTPQIDIGAPLADPSLRPACQPECPLRDAPAESRGARRERQARDTMRYDCGCARLTFRRVRPRHREKLPDRAGRCATRLQGG